MPVYRLGSRLAFPPVDEAEDGLLAVGGDLSPQRLLAAYSAGIFPWYNDGQPLLWHAPDPRFVLPTDKLLIGRSLRKAIAKAPYQLTMDTAFADVIARCAEVPRPGQAGTWITDEMQAAYVKLHELGFAHSVEAWRCDDRDGAPRELVGGFYGISLGALFCGESMFALAPDASKIAFVAACRQLRAWGTALIDCQVHTDHLARFGAVDIPRATYMALLPKLLDEPTRRGKWTFDVAATDV
ncbi:MAG: leucyl/phenylalanyl-tRNA--protein transferase [Myxococcales bacterium]|nr:leucyl/phenylalanyl-tRNA--protein transferase [Myxococcales bacterium]